METMTPPRIHDDMSPPPKPSRQNRLWPYLLIGVYFGIALTKSEVISWFRIQEMFRFQSFHMYGIILSAILIAAISIKIIKHRGIPALDGSSIVLPPKQMGSGTRYWLGGTFFGLGWAMTGACPGPMLALIGAGLPVMVVAVVAAMLGTWTYGALRSRLPH